MRSSRARLVALLSAIAVVAIGTIATALLWPSDDDDQSNAVAGAERQAGKAASDSDASSETSDGAPKAATDAARPAEIVLPTLDISANVLDIGMSTDPDDPDYRTLVPPDDPSVVGWWRDGPIPGATKGSALLLGHTEKVPGKVGIGHGAFGRISQLHKGDPVRVRTEDGSLDYRVTEVEPAMDFDDVARGAEQIDDREYPGGRIVLVTCWYDGGKFTGNTFVFAEPA